jgi:hypothetical protein
VNSPSSVGFDEVFELLGRAPVVEVPATHRVGDVGAVIVDQDSGGVSCVVGEGDAMLGPLCRGGIGIRWLGGHRFEQRRELAQGERAADGARLGLVDVGQVRAFHDQHQVGVIQRVGVGWGAGVTPQVDAAFGQGRHRTR